eukprot:g3923.t1
MGLYHSVNRSCLRIFSGGRVTRHRQALSPFEESTPVVDANVLRRVLTRSDFQGQDLSKIVEEYPELSHVVLTGNKTWIPTDNDLKKLAELPNLTSVDFSGCDGITRRGIMSISSDLDTIKSLILNDCLRISDTFLRSDVCRFRFLEKLELSGCCNISDIGIELLYGLRNLKHLNLSMYSGKKPMTCVDCSNKDKLTDQSLRFVGGIIGLQTLDLSHRSNLTTEGFSSLDKLRSLEHLNLSWTGLTDNCLTILQYFPKLRSLDVSGCSLTENCLSGKLNLASSLTQLNLSNLPGMNDVFLKEMTVLSNLQSLCLSHCKKLTDSGLQHLTKFQSLALLQANTCKGITGSGLLYLSALPHLRKLHLNEAMDTNIDHILRLTNLQILEMGIRASNAEQLTKLTALDKLKDLMLCLSDTTTNFDDMYTVFDGINVQVSVNRH